MIRNELASLHGDHDVPATEERRKLVSALVRWHEVRDDAVKGRNPLARDAEITTPFVNLTDAQSVATSIWNIFSVERMRMNVSVVGGIGRFSIGDTVSVSHPSVGTRSGIVLEVSEDLVAGAASLVVLV